MPSQPNIFAPPTAEELNASPSPDMFAPPTEEERAAPAAGMFAPPTAEETGKPASAEPAGELEEKHINQIADAFGVDRNDLAASAPFIGIRVKGRDSWLDNLRDAEGFIGEAAMMGLPQKAFIYFSSDNEKKALQALRQVAEERKSGWRTAAEIGAGIVTGVATGGALTKGIVAGMEGLSVATLAKAKKVMDLVSLVTSGAVSGAAHADEGEEVEKSLWGAGFAVAGAGVLKVAGKAFGAVVKKVFGTTEIQQANAKRMAAANDSWERLRDQKVEEFKGVWDDVERLFAGESREVPLNGPDDDMVKTVEEVIPANVKGLAAFISKNENINAKKPLSVLQEFLLKQGQAAAATTTKEAAEATSKEASDALLARAEREAANAKAQLLDRWTTYQNLLHVTAEMNSDIEQVYAGRAGARSVTEQLQDAFIDGTWKLRDIDHTNGTGGKLERALLKILDGDAKAQNDLFLVVPKLKELNRGLRAFEEKDQLLIYRALDEGIDNVEGLPEAAKPLVKNIAETFEAFRQVSGALGMPIAKKEGSYVMHAAVERPVYLARMAKRLRDVSKAMGFNVREQGFTEEQFKAFAGTQEGKDTVRAIRLFTTGRPELTTAAAFNEAMREVMDPKRNRIGITEGTNLLIGRLEQDDEWIPDFIREKDVSKLLGTWARNTFRGARLREGVSELMLERDKLAAIGNERDVQYLNNLIQDIAGVRTNTLHGGAKDAAQRAVARWTLKAEDAEAAGRNVQARAFRALAKAPEIVPVLMNQVYPNYLGLKPSAIIMNLTQPLMMTVPELGYGYGAPRMMLALGRVVSALRNPAAYGHALREAGAIKPNWNTELQDVLAGSIQRSAKGQMAVGALEKLTGVAMWGFEHSEKLNRALVYEMGEMVTKDLFDKGASVAARRGARAFVERAGGALNMEVMEQLIAKGDSAAARKLITDHLINKTLFNYSRATMSEFGRFVGPVLATFTKWPMAVGGDGYEQLRRHGGGKGSLEIGRRYVAPLLAAWALDRAAAEHGMDPEESPATRAILGKGGLTKAAPLGTVKALFDGSLLEPPVIQVVKTLFEGVKQGDAVGTTWRLFNAGAEAFGPGAVLGHTWNRYQDLRDDNPDATNSRKATFTQRVFPNVELDDSVKELDERIKEPIRDLLDR